MTREAALFREVAGSKADDIATERLEARFDADGMLLGRLVGTIETSGRPERLPRVTADAALLNEIAGSKAEDTAPAMLDGMFDALEILGRPETILASIVPGTLWRLEGNTLIAVGTEPSLESTPPGTWLLEARPLSGEATLLGTPLPGTKLLGTTPLASD